VARWWRRWPSANIGLRTGAVSGLVVVDVDPGHGGAASIRALASRHPGLRDAPRVRTGSGGWHLYFGHPGGVVPNSAGRLGPGLDVRGDGGYVIAPPSQHVSGGTYTWQSGRLTDLPRLPTWLQDAARRPPRRPAVERTKLPSGDSRIGGAWARAALDSELVTVRDAVEGTRNSTLNRSAFRVGQIVGAGLLGENHVEGLLVDAGIDAGLGEREAVLTVRSGLRAGMSQPRSPSPPAMARRAAPSRSVADVAMP